MKKILVITIAIFGLTTAAFAQTPLLYQISREGGNCAGDTITLTVRTFVNLSTLAITEIGNNSAASGGNITNDGGNPVLQRGICWSTNPNPTTANNSTTNGNGLGSYTNNLTGLMPNTLYYVRAYAVNSVGTFYGNQVSFSTIFEIGNITTLNCSSATNNGTLTAGQAASGVSSVVPYTGGNGGTHSGQTVSSTGVTGLTATLTAGAFENGNGNLTYTITGTPLANGTASFALNIGGRTCTLSLTVGLPAGTITALNCGSATNNGTLTAGQAASGVSSVVPYTGGNGGTHSGQSASSTGVTGLTATLTAGTFTSGNGNLTYIITGTPSASGTASFALNIGGRTCTLSLTVGLPAGTITALNCGSATNNGTLTAGQAASGVSSVVPYTGGNGGTHSGQSVSSTGVTGLTATLTAGTFTSGNGTLTYTITGTPPASGTASFALNIGGRTCTLSLTVGLPAGTITALNCGSATNNGTLTAGQAASGVSSVVPYTGGNGGTHSGQSVSSTGVTGLTATLTAGTFTSGNGNLTYIITGTPSASGTASFALNIGGRTCTLSLTVGLPAGTITALNCGSATNNGTLTAGQAASGVSSVVPYTGGNGGTHSGQSVSSTGVTGLTATLTAGTFTSGNGTLTYTITGTPPASGTASFALNIGGRTCTLSLTVGLPAGTITALNCGSATNNGTLTAGQAASGMSSVVPYTGGNGGTHSGQTVNSTGVTGLTATLSPGTFANGSGSLTYNISGTPNGGGSASFALNIGGRTCTLSLTAGLPAGTITALNCSSATNNGTLTAGQAASGVSSVVPYTGGNGGTHSGQTVTSTGVTGLTATLTAGTFASGNGTLTYNITGIPSASGTANFALNIGGKTCTLTRAVNPVSTANCGATNVHNPAKTYGTMTDQNGNVYKTIVIGTLEWMAENLKANNYRNGDLIPTITDDLQWSTQTTGASCWYNNSSATYDCPYGKLYNWYAMADPRNVCPTGWHMPTDAEWTILTDFLGEAGVAGGKMKSAGAQYWQSPNTGATNESGFSGLPGGQRNYDGTFNDIGLYSYWWTSSSLYQGLTYSGSSTGRDGGGLNSGFAIRCIKDTVIGNDSSATCGANNVHNPAKTYGTMIDQDGNVYKTIVISTQEWMAENLKANTYSNGDLIPTVTDDIQWSTQTTGASCWNNNSTSTYDCPYGKLYNWYSVADPRNICPTGWRVPTNADWTTLTSILDGESLAGGKMKSAGLQYWETPNSGASNESGFSGLPGGVRGNNGSFYGFGNFGNWWSSTQINPASSLTRELYYLSDNISVYGEDKRSGFSVRCLRDNITQGFINFLDCGSATNNGALTAGQAAGGVSSTVPYTGGNGGTHNGQMVTSTGVTGLTAILATGTFASGNGNLTYTITGTPSASGTASFALNIGGRTCTLTRTVNSISTASCGATNVHNPTKTYGTMTDQNGNVYKTIVIGTQEWMAENLKANNYRNGDLIPTITDDVQWSGLTTGASCWYDNSSATYDCPHGKLYNWYAVADPRNVCPTGWHAPTEEEWTTLTDFLGFDEIAGGKMKSAGTQYWEIPNNSATNESGFSGLPGGDRYFIDGTFSEVGYNGYWWSSTEIDSTFAYSRGLFYFDGNATRFASYKRSGHSIRCIRD